MEERFRQAVAFESALRERAADRAVRFPLGTVVLTPSLPEVWDLNFVRVDESAGIDAETLAGWADRLLGHAGLPHRRLVVGDEKAGLALEPGFAALGWRVSRFLFMGHEGAPPPDPGVSVEDVPLAALHEIRTELSHVAPGGWSPAVARQLLAAGERVARAGAARHLAVVRDGRPVAATDLYSDGRTAQIEDVVTLAAHRRRGYGRAVVARGVAEALAAGHELVFLVADAGDWPKDLYARLGFVTLGTTYVFAHEAAGAPGSGRAPRVAGS